MLYVLVFIHMDELECVCVGDGEEVFVRKCALVHEVRVGVSVRICDWVSRWILQVPVCV